MNLRQLVRLRNGSIVDGFKDLLVKDVGLLGLEGDLHPLERIGQPLNSYPDRSVPPIGCLGLWNRVVVDIDDFVEVPGDYPCDLHQFLKIVDSISVQIFDDVSGKGNGC